jgi:hypothetical protein
MFSAYMQEFNLNVLFIFKFILLNFLFGPDVWTGNFSFKFDELCLSVLV